MHAYIIASYTLSIYVRYVQRMDLHNPWVALHKVVIDTLNACEFSLMNEYLASYVTSYIASYISERYIMIVSYIII